jgi:hypothetical protein
MAQARATMKARNVSALLDAVARDERVKALRSYLDATPQAARWTLWAGERLTARVLANTEATAEAACLAEAMHEDVTFADPTLAAHRSHARYLLSVAYGADEARRAALADWAEETTPDDDDGQKAIARARRVAVKAAVDAIVAHLKDSEPKCPATVRGATAMLILLSDSALLTALPGTIRARFMLPDALRNANLLLPQSAQVDADSVTHS